MKSNLNIIIIGAGGITSYLLPLLIRLWPDVFKYITIMDADRLQPDNLNRQNFAPKHLRFFKAHALSVSYDGLLRRIDGATIDTDLVFYRDINQIQDILNRQSLPDAPCLLISCADNHPTRARVIETVDSPVIETKTIYGLILGNETKSWDAMLVGKGWQETPQHPFSYYPEIATSEQGDPTRPCTDEEEIQASGGQLPLANNMAAAHGIQLLSLWKPWVTGLVANEDYRHLVYRYSGNGVHTKSYRYDDN